MAPTSPEAAYREYRNGMFVFALHLLHNQADAEDCVQEAAVRILRFWSDCHDSEKVRSWMLTVVKNQALDMMRKRRCRQPQPENPLPSPVVRSHENAILARVTIEHAAVQLTPREREALAEYLEPHDEPHTNTEKTRRFRAMHHMRELCSAATA